VSAFGLGGTNAQLILSDAEHLGAGPVPVRPRLRPPLRRRRRLWVDSPEARGPRSDSQANGNARAYGGATASSGTATNGNAQSGRSTEEAGRVPVTSWARIEFDDSAPSHLELS
jgi:hypothetical protein